MIQNNNTNIITSNIIENRVGFFWNLFDLKIDSTIDAKSNYCALKLSKIILCG